MRFYSVTLTSETFSTNLTFAKIQADTANEASQKAMKMLAEPHFWVILDIKII